MNVRSILIGLGIAVAAQGMARADDPGAGAGSAAAVEQGIDTYPLAVRDRPDLLWKGMLEIDGDTLVINLSDSAAFKPVAISPSAYYALTEQDQVGIILGGGVLQQGGICLTGSDNGCPKVFDSLGLNYQRLFVGDGQVHIIGHAGVEFESFNAGWVGVPIGVRFHFVINDKLDALVDPTIQIGLTHRDEGNKEFLSIPVTIRYQSDPAAQRLHRHRGRGLHRSRVGQLQRQLRRPGRRRRDLRDQPPAGRGRRVRLHRPLRQQRQHWTGRQLILRAAYRMK